MSTARIHALKLAVEFTDSTHCADAWFYLLSCPNHRSFPLLGQLLSLKAIQQKVNHKAISPSLNWISVTATSNLDSKNIPVSLMHTGRCAPSKLEL